MSDLSILCCRWLTFKANRISDEIQGFNLESILKVDAPVLNKLIEKVGFHVCIINIIIVITSQNLLTHIIARFLPSSTDHGIFNISPFQNNKTRFIKAAAEILRVSHDSDIPDTIDGLVSLPGVGPKMAYLCMSAAWGRDEGIGVDVHVHRITNLWGWHATKTPEETRAMLEAWLPREKWHKINHLLVGFGQTICLPVGRRCWECDLAKEGLCPSAVLVGKMREMELKVKKKKVKEESAGIIKSEDGLTAEDENKEEREVKVEPTEEVVGEEAGKDRSILDGVGGRRLLDLEDVV